MRAASAARARGSQLRHRDSMLAFLSVAATAIHVVCLLSGKSFAVGVPVNFSAEPKTVEIAPNVFST